MKDFYILLVDDNEEILCLLAEALILAGYSVSVAKNGSDALKKLNFRSFDLIITDYEMPDIDGISLIKKARELLPQMAAVVITGNPSAQEIEEGREAGAYSVLAKPFEIRSLISIVEAIRDKKGPSPRRDFYWRSL